MNKILNLFDENYVLEMFKDKLLPLYAQYVNIKKVSIKPYKKMVWQSTYHVVIGFNVVFETIDKKEEKVLIVCSAHSEEPRENVFKAMKHLWQYNFNGENIDIPRPLLYSEYFKGTFYQGIVGENLMQYIKYKEYEKLEEMIPLAAKLFVKLHELPATADSNFNPMNARIETVVPGSDIIIREMSHRYEGKFKKDFELIYKHLIEKEEYYLKQKDSKLSLIHGDAHTENIIHTGENRVGLIDFTDLCLGDFARDLGTFVQQLEFKIVNRHGDVEKAKEMTSLFLSSYFSASDKNFRSNLDERIKLYYNWTTARTSVYFFIKHDSDPYRAEILLNKVKKDLGL